MCSSLIWGLLIIDEEQKFGVELKERIKKTASMVDILTLSATPIPRTLHMSLLGVRDISNLETAPEERMAVETRVVRFDDALVRNAILRELNRDGQIFFVHNRIEDMHSIAARLQRIAPEARILIGHGQMAEGRARASHARFHRPPSGHLAGYDYYRERSGHSECQHDFHRRSQSVWTIRAAPIARSSRSLQASGALLSARRSRSQPQSGCGPSIARH